jgi:hypothetical protein
LEPAREVTVVRPAEGWAHWPVYWSAVWVGVLAALAVALIFGLVGGALGAHELTPGHRIVKWSDLGVGALAFGVFGAFIAFAVGGWVAAKIGGIRRSEPAMLHGAIVWLVAVPLLLALAALGAGSHFGGWYDGLVGTPGWVTPAAVPNAPVDPNAALAARNAALAAATALLIGLVGGVVGGWMASGEPMTFTHYRTRDMPSTTRRTI